MPINFPDAPALNQLFTSGNKTWKWTGTVWEIVVIDELISSESINSDTSISAKKKYFIDTSTNITLTLPADPAIGDQIELFDATGTASTHNVTILNNSNKINGVLDSAILDINAFAAVLVYTGSTYGWRLV